MKKFLIIVFVACVLISCKTENNTESTAIYLGDKDKLFSKILNEDREIWIYNPGNQAGPRALGKKKYPVIYLLDGDAHFHSVAGMVRQLSGICPDMMVVAIPNTDRTRDLTHTHVDVVFGDSTFSKTSGGGEKFTEFIEQELIPYVDAKYPTTSHRTLIGHSLGGLFAVNTLIHHPDLFRNYLAIDPSMWWDNRGTLKSLKEKLNDLDLNKKWLYVAVANTMDKGLDLATVENDTAESSEHIRSILEFNKFMDANKGPLNFKSDYYPDDNHGSVPFIAEYDALRFMFSWYNYKGIDEFFFPDSKLTPNDAIDKITNHFKMVSENLGYEVKPDEGMINGIGYGFLGNNKSEHAYAFFKLNIENYPQSSNVYDSMGDYYLNQKDTTSAITNFKKALEIEEVPHTRTKLESLSK